MTGEVLLYIHKCFDRIDHQLLNLKIYKYGVRNIESMWFNSYLFNGRLTVHCNGTCLNKRTANLGVPQGSVLGPLPFMLFLNDLPQHIVNGICSMYADDTILYCYGVDVPLSSRLQQCLNCASRWYAANRLVLNTANGSVMLFGASIDDNEKSNCKHFIANTGI